jgi:hypothetical protein
MHPRAIRGQRRSSPRDAPEDNAGLYPHFLPYDGLWIASDKVLGKLFLRNGWISFESHIGEFFIIHNLLV